MRKSNGFTLLEVLMALTILSVFITILQRQQVIAVNRRLLGQQQIERIFLMRKQLLKAYFFLATKPKIKKLQVDASLMQITTSKLQINKKSSLKDFAPNIKILACAGEWKSENQERNLKLYTFVLDVKDEKKNV